MVNIPNESIKRNFKETFTNNIKSFESDIQNYSKDLEEKTEKLTNDKILEFIDKNSKKWNLKVFDSDPSYNLFDLRGIRRIEEIKNINEKEGKLSLKNSESESPLTSSESSFDRKQRKSPNQIDEDINSEILKEFMNLLEKISDFTEKSQNPASVINNNRLDNVTHLYKNESNKDGINL